MNKKVILCSLCFEDQGIKLLAERIGEKTPGNCSNCSNLQGVKLNIDQLQDLAYRFFVVGSIFKTDYGAAPLIQFNKHQKTNVQFSESLKKDVSFLKKFLESGSNCFNSRG